MNSIPFLRRLRAAACALAALACGTALAQKIDDVPPAVQNNVPPNFMFMIDNSGSMSNIVPTTPYSATATYATGCTNVLAPVSTATVDLRVVSGAPKFNYNGKTFRHATAAGKETAACFDNKATYNARLLADSTSSSGDRVPGNYLDTEYSGHFLNWYFGDVGHPMSGWIDRKLVNSGLVSTRIEIARRSAKTIIDSLPLTASGGRAAVRLGLSTYRAGGGALRVPMQDLNAGARITLKDSIDKLTPSGATPLSTTFADIARYLATGYNGNVVTARSTTGINIDKLLAISGTDNTPRNACLSNTPVACDAPAPQPVNQPIQYWCQRSAIVAMTDGRPQLDRGFDNNDNVKDYDGDCSGVNASNCKDRNGNLLLWDRKNNRNYEDFGSDYMDDVAKLLFDVDWRPDITKPAPVPPASKAKNNIRTYVIGFADPAVQNDPLLINTAKQGGGLFLSANDETTLNEAFRSALADALAKDAAAAAVAVTNTRISTGTAAYASSFNAGTWTGDLEAFLVDPSTGVQADTASWNAREKLQAQVSPLNTRRIVSFDGKAGVPFTTTNGPTFRLAAPSLSDDLIGYTRGSNAGEGGTFRSRQFVLGDIINAEPVVVNYPNGIPVVFQAANDGMLHAFDGRVTAPTEGPDTRGQELWAYVPSLVHSKLAARADPLFEHQYLVDGTPAVADTTVNGTLTRILVGGLGKGGVGYYALDVTTGSANTETEVARKVLWEAKPANMGYSYGVPHIVQTSAGWKVVVTSGYRNDPAGAGGDGRGHVYVLEPLTGKVLREYVTPAGFGSLSAPLGLAHLGRLANTSPSAPVRYLYGGDLQGNVWRVDLDAPAGSELVRIAAVTTATGDPQPITVPPVVGPVSGSSSSFFVYFGTGQYFSSDDVPGTATPNAFATQQETIYGIIDDTLVATPKLPKVRGTNGATCPTNGGDGALVCQAVSAGSGNTPFRVTHNALDPATRRGFYIDLPLRGQRVNTPLALSAGGTLVVAANLPSNTTCNPGGSSMLFELSGANGGEVPKTFGGADFYPATYVIGDALTSRPLLVDTAKGRKAMLRGSDKITRVIDVVETAGTSPKFKRIYMRPLN